MKTTVGELCAADIGTRVTLNDAKNWRRDGFLTGVAHRAGYGEEAAPRVTVSITNADDSRWTGSFDSAWPLIDESGGHVMTRTSRCRHCGVEITFDQTVPPGPYSPWYDESVVDVDDTGHRCPVTAVEHEPVDERVAS